MLYLGSLQEMSLADIFLEIQVVHCIQLLKIVKTIKIPMKNNENLQFFVDCISSPWRPFWSSSPPRRLICGSMSVRLAEHGGMKLSRRHRKSFHSSTSTNKSSPIKILQFSFTKIKMEPFLPYFSTRDTEAHLGRCSRWFWHKEMRELVENMKSPT